MSNDMPTIIFHVIKNLFRINYWWTVRFRCNRCPFLHPDAF